MEMEYGFFFIFFSKKKEENIRSNDKLQKQKLHVVYNVCEMLYKYIFHISLAESGFHTRKNVQHPFYARLSVRTKCYGVHDKESTKGELADIKDRNGKTGRYVNVQ